MTNITPTDRELSREHLREHLLVRFLGSSIMSEYDSDTHWAETKAMIADGLVTARGVITGTAAVTLTRKGCDAAVLAATNIAERKRKTFEEPTATEK